MYDIIISGVFGFLVGLSVAGGSALGAFLYTKKRRYVSPIQQNGGCGSEWK